MIGRWNTGDKNPQINRSIGPSIYTRENENHGAGEKNPSRTGTIQGEDWRIRRYGERRDGCFVAAG
jgi:hypothetical protein